MTQQLSQQRRRLAGRLGLNPALCDNELVLTVRKVHQGASTFVIQSSGCLYYSSSPYLRAVLFFCIEARA